jgi:hypothetical protein
MGSRDERAVESAAPEPTDDQLARRLFALREQLDGPFRLMGVVSLALMACVLLPFRMHWLIAVILVGVAAAPFVWIYRIWRCPRCGSSLEANIRHPACPRGGAKAA